MKKVLSRAEISSLLRSRFHEAKRLYIDQDYTAKRLAEHFHIFFTPNFQKSCFIVFGPKGKGLGGARLGAGNSRIGREERKKKKSDYQTIAVRLSPEDIDFLRKQGGHSFSATIERALAYYRAAVHTITEKQQTQQS